MQCVFAWALTVLSCCKVKNLLRFDVCRTAIVVTIRPITVVGLTDLDFGVLSQIGHLV